MLINLRIAGIMQSGRNLTAEGQTKFAAAAADRLADAFGGHPQFQRRPVGAGIRGRLRIKERGQYFENPAMPRFDLSLVQPVESGP